MEVMYKCIFFFYDKALEQKKLFQQFEQDLTYENRQEKNNGIKTTVINSKILLDLKHNFTIDFLFIIFQKRSIKRVLLWLKKLLNLCSGYWTMLQAF